MERLARCVEHSSARVENHVRAALKQSANARSHRQGSPAPRQRRVILVGAQPGGGCLGLTQRALQQHDRGLVERARSSSASVRGHKSISLDALEIRVVMATTRWEPR